MKIPLKLIFLITLLTAACKEENPYAPTGGTELKIEASSDNIVLTAENDNNIAVTFKWNKGYEYNDNISVTYCFKIDIADNGFASATELEVLGPDVFEKSLTVGELNDLCIERWGIIPGDGARLEAKVIARLTSDKFIMPEVATTAFNVTTYALPSRPLYILIDTDGSGWDISKAIQMTEEILSRQYSYKARFTAGTKYIFPQQANSILPAWFRGSGASTISLHENEEGTPFTVSKDATYELIVNTKDASIESIYYPEYENIYLVGDVCGWNIDDAIRLTWVTGTAQFIYEGQLPEGELKFAAGAKSWDVPYYMAMTEGCSDLSLTSMQLVQPGGVDYKWRITSPGNYRVTLDIDALTIIFEKL